jgi:hypothetical protein
MRGKPEGQGYFDYAATRPEALMKGIVFPSSALEYS